MNTADTQFVCKKKHCQKIVNWCVYIKRQIFVINLSQNNHVTLDVNSTIYAMTCNDSRPLSRIPSINFSQIMQTLTLESCAFYLGMLVYVDKTRQDTFICAISKYHLVTVKQLNLATFVLFVFKFLKSCDTTL